MRLYSGKVDSIATDIIKTLVNAEDIEVSNRPEAELDVVSVLKEYLRLDRELTERAKDIMEIRGLSYSAFGRTKRTLAEQKDFGLGEEGVSWMCTQILELFMRSAHIEEIFADDGALRRKMKAVLHRHMMVDEELDKEVRERIRNLEEGTNAWDVEYGRVMDQMKTKHGIKE